MDLSKAFITINDDLLLEKRHAYGVKENSLKLLISYLRNSKPKRGEFSA